MLHRPLLALPNERSAGQDHCQHGYVVDDLHDRGEPVRVEVRIELGSDHDVYGRAYGTFAAGLEVGELLRDDGLYVHGTVTGLRHGRSINVQLQGGLPASQQVRLEAWRD